MPSWIRARYTHRVAISNRRLIAFNKDGVTFRYKDYRADGRARYKRMTLAPGEFIRRFLIHVLPKGFHRIRHYGLFVRLIASPQKQPLPFPSLASVSRVPLELPPRLPD